MRRRIAQMNSCKKPLCTASGLACAFLTLHRLAAIKLFNECEPVRREALPINFACSQSVLKRPSSVTTESGT